MLAEVFIEVHESHAGLDEGVGVLLVDLQDPVASAACRARWPRSPAAPRPVPEVPPGGYGPDRNAVLIGYGQDGLYLLHRSRKHRPGAPEVLEAAECIGVLVGREIRARAEHRVVAERRGEAPVGRVDPPG